MLSAKSSNPVFLGIVFYTINAFMLASMSLFCKLLATYFGPIEITFFRNAISLVALCAVILYFKKLYILKTKRPWAHILRSFMGTAGILIGTWSLALLPLAEVTLLFFTSPLFIVIISRLLLKEQIGIYRASAVIFGFIGVLIIIIPSSTGQALSWLGIVLALIWAFSSACVDICLRWMGDTEKSSTTTFYFVLFGAVTTAFYWPFAEIKPNAFAPEALWFIVGAGMTGLLALLAKTQSFRLAEVSAISPILYTMIVWTILFDYLFWDKIPTINTITGAIIIIASNLFIIYRETKVTKVEN